MDASRYATLIDGYVLLCFIVSFVVVLYQCIGGFLVIEPVFEMKDSNGSPVKVPLQPSCPFAQ